MTGPLNQSPGGWPREEPPYAGPAYPDDDYATAGPPRRERWPRVLAGLIAVILLAMGGVAAWAYTRPHRHLHLDLIPAGLGLGDGEMTAEASDLQARLGDTIGSNEQSTAYVETVAGTTVPIEVIGGTQNEDDVSTSITHLSELVATSSFRTGSGPLHLDDRPPGARGGRLRCAPVVVGTTQSSVCVWADADTVGFTFAPLTEDQLADVTARIRVDVER